MLLVVLSALLGVVSVACSWREIRESVGFFHFNLLWTLAGAIGVFLALENHGGIVAEADGVLAIARAVESPWFGVNLDSGNFHTADIYGDLAKIAPYAINVQVKVQVHPPGKPDEPSDFKRLGQILKASGYRGYIALEYEGRGDPRQECPKYIDQIRAAFA